MDVSNFVRRVISATHAKTTAQSILQIATECTEPYRHDQPALLASLGAFLTAALSPTGQFSQNVPIDAISVCTITSVVLSIDDPRPQLQHWERFMETILIAQPPFPTEVTVAVAHCIAVAHSQRRYGLQVLKKAAVALEAVSDGTELPFSCSVELLAQLTQLYVTRSFDTKLLGGNVTPDSITPETVVESCLVCLATEQMDASAAATVTRRLLIPLLTYRKEMVAQFGSKVIVLLKDLSTKALLAELIVLIAALFDFLFRAPNLNPGEDFRFDSFLWESIVAALRAALESSEDAGKRATMQLKVTYLLKRIVALTAEQSNNQTITAPVRFHDNFVWYPKAQESEHVWNEYFLIFETLNEYGVHINAPALAKLDALLQKLGSSFQQSWLELLLVKALLHPNTGVRKLTLRRLWSMKTSIVTQLSMPFVCSNCFLCAADVRLCGEIDRIAMPGNFLECKVFDGREEQSLPKVLPMVEEMEKFYSAYINVSCTTAAMQAAACLALIQTVDGKTTRFTIAVLLRVLCFVTKELKPADCSETGLSLASPSIHQALFSFLKETVQDKHPYWLETRFNAVMLDTLLYIAVHFPAVLEQPGFRRLLAACGPLGETGGRAVSTIDASGCVGSIGSALPTPYVVDRIATKLAHHDRLLAVISRRNTLDDLEKVLHSSVDESAIKGVFAFTTLLPSESIATVHTGVLQNLVSLCHREYVSPKQLCAGAWCYSECVKSLPLDRVVTLTTPDSLLTIWQALLATMRRALASAFDKILSVASPEDFSVEGSVWEWMRTTEWDALCSAVYTVTHVALHHSDTFLESYRFEATLVSLVDSVERISQLGSSLPSPGSQLAHIIVCRSTARLLHSVLSAFVSEPTTFSALFARHVPFKSRSIMIAKLMKSNCFSLHLNAGDIPCSLTSHSWGTILAQYFRYLYNTVHTLVSCTTSNELGDEGAVLSLLTSVEEFASQQLDMCSTSNLSSVFDLIAWVLYASSTLASEITLPFSPESLVRTLFSRLDDTQRREYFRCAAISVYGLRYCTDANYIVKTMTSLLKDETESERVIFFVASLVSTMVMGDVETYWPLYKDVLLHIAVIYNSGKDEEELEACLAATEPLFSSWPDALRETVTPSVRLASLGRAMAISVILYACSQDAKRALDLSIELVRWNVTNPIVNHEPCMPNSKAHRSRIRLWQLLCGIIPTLDHKGDWRALIQLVMKKCLSINNMGSVRRFMELYLVGAFFKNPALYPLLADVLDDFSLRPQICGSYALVVVHLLLDSHSSVDGLFDTLFPRLVRLCSSNQHLLRIISHIGVHRLVLERTQSSSWKPTPEVKALYEFINRAQESLKFREKHEGMVLFDSRAALAPRQLFCIQRKETQTWLKESVPAVSFDRMVHLENELNSVLGCVSPFELLRSHFLKQWFLGGGAELNIDALKDSPLIPHSTCGKDLYVDFTLESMEAVTADDTLADDTQATDNIQRKVTSWWNSEVYNELHPRALGSNERQSIVIVGSLLENPVNIAGLCRCGEIFTVEKVTVPDKKVFEHPHFVATARSAELWIPWEEVHPMNLVAYLQQMKEEGYTLIGIEQTSSSVSMANYKFPERAVIVLGSEGQGIPSTYLPFLDVCVEIPQYGLIRSLNVHVTGAIAMYEFTKQHLMSKDTHGAQHPSNIPSI